MGPEGKGACHAWICQCDFFLRRTDVRFFRCAQCGRKRCGIPRTRNWSKAWASPACGACPAGPTRRAGPAKRSGYVQRRRTGGRPARSGGPCISPRPGCCRTTSWCYRHSGWPSSVALWGYDALFFHWRSACSGHCRGFIHHSCCPGSQCRCHARFGCCARLCAGGCAAARAQL